MRWTLQWWGGRNQEAGIRREEGHEGEKKKPIHCWLFLGILSAPLEPWFGYLQPLFLARTSDTCQRENLFLLLLIHALLPCSPQAWCTLAQLFSSFPFHPHVFSKGLLFTNNSTSRLRASKCLTHELCIAPPPLTSFPTFVRKAKRLSPSSEYTLQSPAQLCTHQLHSSAPTYPIPVCTGCVKKKRTLSKVYYARTRFYRNM